MLAIMVGVLIAAFITNPGSASSLRSYTEPQAQT